MSSDKPDPDHAKLEAQRQRSNVYAFRRLKWGTPERPGARAPRVRVKAPLPLRKPSNSRTLTVALLVVIGFICGAIAVFALG